MGYSPHSTAPASTAIQKEPSRAVFSYFGDPGEMVRLSSLEKIGAPSSTASRGA